MKCPLQLPIHANLSIYERQTPLGSLAQMRKLIETLVLVMEARCCVVGDDDIMKVSFREKFPTLIVFLLMPQDISLPIEMT